MSNLRDEWAGAHPRRVHSRVFPLRTGCKPYMTSDGLWTVNANGFDLAEIVCQPCVLSKCGECEHEPHEPSGWSLCLCNNSRD